mgnify:CR=1 FL=1
MKYAFCFLAVFLVPAILLAADLEKGKAIYSQRCVSCHGASGLGDGPIGAGLPPAMKPRDFQTAAFKYATDDAKMKDVITKGGVPFGLNPLMAPQAGLSDEDLNNIVAYVRSLKKK